MASVKDKLHNMNLRAAFVTVVLITLCVVLVLSIGTIVAGNLFRQWLFPQKDQLAVTFNIEYTNGTAHTSERRIDIGNAIFSFNQDGNDISEYFNDKLISQGSNSVAPIKNMTITADHIVPSIDLLSPKRKFAYSATAVLMIALPLFYAFAGVLYCAFWFYKRKLAIPIRWLSEATDHIKNKDLDFSIPYHSNDEMGRLCVSFETMRTALDESNKKQWALLEEQRTLHASVAHDLRNPIAILQGYTEYLQIQLSAGTLTEEKLKKTLTKFEQASKRLEAYTDSIRETAKVDGQMSIFLPDTLQEMADDFRVIVESGGRHMTVAIDSKPLHVSLDVSTLYRVLENLIVNAARFAKTTVAFTCKAIDTSVHITITDDGCGFSDDILQKQQGEIQLDENEHRGLGLPTCHDLCRQNNWELRLTNDAITKGACATVTIPLL